MIRAIDNQVLPWSAAPQRCVSCRSSANCRRTRRNASSVSNLLSSSPHRSDRRSVSLGVTVYARNGCGAAWLRTGFEGSELEGKSIAQKDGGLRRESAEQRERDVTDIFLRWTLIRAVFHRGYVLVALLYFVVDAHLSASQLTLLATTMSITHGFANIPAGALADAIGRRWPLAIGHLFLAGGMMMTGLVVAFPLIVATQVLWGLGWAFSEGADVAWLNDELDRPDRIDRLYDRACPLGPRWRCHRHRRFCSAGLGGWLHYCARGFRRGHCGARTFRDRAIRRTEFRNCAPTRVECFLVDLAPRTDPRISRPRNSSRVRRDNDRQRCCYSRLAVSETTRQLGSSKRPGVVVGDERRIRL